MFQRSWLYGQQWEHDLMGKEPCKEDMDAVVGDRPFVAMRVCCHILVVNSKALKAAGKTSPKPVTHFNYWSHL